MDDFSVAKGGWKMIPVDQANAKTHSGLRRVKMCLCPKPVIMIESFQSSKVL